MTYHVYIQLNYKHKKVRKFFKVLNVLDSTHMKKVLTTNLRLKFRNMINFEIIETKRYERN